MNAEIFNPEKRRVTPEEREILDRTLGDLGLVLADIYEGPTATEVETDSVWKSVN